MPLSLENQFDVVALGGPIGSGKSTFLTLLTKELRETPEQVGAVRLSADTYRSQVLGMSVMEAKHRSDLNKIVFPTLEYMARMFLQSGISVVRDFKHPTEEIITRGLSDRITHDGQPIPGLTTAFVWVDTPREIAIDQAIKRTGQNVAIVDDVQANKEYDIWMDELAVPQDYLEHLIVINGLLDFSEQYEQFAEQARKIPQNNLVL